MILAMRWILAALLFVAPFPATRAATPRAGYTPAATTCDGYPRAQIGMAPGFCAGVVLSPPPEGQLASKRVLHLPRSLLALPDGAFLVSDLGTWDAGHGAIWRLTPQPGSPPRLERLLDGLDLPHTLGIGPDGVVYVGEMSRIFRFDPAASDPKATLRTVVDGLPSNRLHANRHPLSSFIFDADGALLVNVGAPSDQCEPQPGQTTCPEGEGERPAAAVWRYARVSDGWSQTPTIFARGLRNSLALVRHRSGAIYQAENSIDVADPAFPPDEINRLRPGRHYGWPYCVGANEPAPAWRGKVSCKTGYERPVSLLAPHSAPLAMIYYEGDMFPELRGQLLVTLHGFRSTGARLMAYAVDAQGAPKPDAKPRYAASLGAGVVRKAYRFGPAANGKVLTPGWRATAGRRPTGSPVGLAIAADGAIWLAEDRNGAILRISRDRP